MEMKKCSATFEKYILYIPANVPTTAHPHDLNDVLSQLMEAEGNGFIKHSQHHFSNLLNKNVLHFEVS